MTLNQTTSFHWDHFDFQGRDMLSVQPVADTTFCVATRLGWIYFGTLIRADVRVYWPKKIPDATAAAQGVAQSNFTTFRSTCAVPAGTPDDMARFHAVYLPNTLRVTTL